MKGHIQLRGPKTWRLKFDVDRNAGSGKRTTKFVTFHGTKREAQSELARLIGAVNSGNFIDSSKVTVATYLRAWIDIAEAVAISPKTAERYRQLIERQTIPHLGAVRLQNLRVAWLVCNLVCTYSLAHEPKTGYAHSQDGAAQWPFWMTN